MIPPPGGAIPVRTVRMFECGCRIIDFGPGSPQRVLMCNAGPADDRPFADPSRREDGTGQWEVPLTAARLGEIAAELERTTPKFVRAIIGTCGRCGTKYGFWARYEDEYAICATCGQIQTGLARNPFDFRLTRVSDTSEACDDHDREFDFACGCKLFTSAWVDARGFWLEESTAAVCGPDHAKFLAAHLHIPAARAARFTWTAKLGKIGADRV